MKKILSLAVVFALMLTCGITLAACGSKATAPKAVATFTATAGNTQVVLNWTAGNDGGKAITSYELMYAETASIASATWNDIGNITTKTISGLTNGTGYTFKIRAINEKGAGAEKTATATPVATQLSAPTASIVSNELHWARITTLGTGEDYEFLVSNGRTSKTLGDVGGWNQTATTRNITIGNLIAEAFDMEFGSYTIKVRAVGNGTTYLTSAWSNAITHSVCVETLEQFFSAINNIKGNYTVTATYNWDGFLMEHDIQVNGNVSYMAVNYSGEEAGEPVEGSYYRCFLIDGVDYNHYYSDDGGATWSCTPVKNKNHTVLTEQQFIGWWLAVSPYSSVTLAVSDFEETSENNYQAELITLPSGDAVKGTLNYFTIEIQENNRVLIEFEIKDGAKVMNFSMTITFGAATITEADVLEFTA